MPALSMISSRSAFLIGFTALCVAAAVLVSPMPQPLDYHRFVDQRGAFGIPNFGDVISNIGFLIAGLIGLYVVARAATCFEQGIERLPYAVFFIGLLLTALGSSYYHLAPDNERLFWDRLPMTVGFMSLIAAQVVDRIGVRVGLRLLIPMLIVGAGSVIYWLISERAGEGNVIPYGILQGYAIVAVLLLAVLHPSRYTRGNDVYWVFAWYLIAKLLEHFDAWIYELTGVISGHSLKHLAAGAAGLVVCVMLLKRQRRIDRQLFAAQARPKHPQA
jgi:hypothetical protein